MTETSTSETTQPDGDEAVLMLDGCVDVSMLINQLFVFTLKAEGLSGNVDREVLSITSAFEELTASIREITQNAQDVRDSSERVSNSVCHGQSTAHRAIENMRTITSVVGEAQVRTEALAEATQEIDASLTRIQSIANQTNLLALNATIQAARAGEAGRGFAVVANEVKQLSSQTAATANEISSVLQRLRASLEQTGVSMATVREAVTDGQQVSEELSDSMNEIGDLAQRNRHASEDISRALDQQADAANEVSRSAQVIKSSSQKSIELAQSNARLGRSASQRVEGLIAHIAERAGTSDSCIVKLAKSDHLVWKRKFHDYLFGETKLTEADLTSHEHCRLGRWYYEQGRALLGGSSAFLALEDPHRRVHSLGRKIWERVADDDHDGAVALLDDFEAASGQVIELLDRLDGELYRSQR